MIYDCRTASIKINAKIKALSSFGKIWYKTEKWCRYIRSNI